MDISIWWLRLILFHSLLCSAIAWGQNHDLGAGVTLTKAQLQQLQQRLPRTTQAKVFFHWTSFANYLRWSRQGHIDSGEVAFFNRPTGNLQVYGPGIYMAASPTSSQSFGVAAVTFSIPAGTTIIEPTDVRQILGRALDQQQLSKLGELFPSIRNINGDWHVANHPSMFSRVEMGDLHGASVDWARVDIMKLRQELYAASEHHADARYLSKVFELFSYMDGVSLYRAIKVNPGAPWSEFETQRFETYWRGRQQLFEATHSSELASKEMGVISFGVVNGQPGTEAWARLQIEKTLPHIFSQLTGQRHAQSDAILRTEGVRGGGNYESETFLATDAELAQLQRNKFIEVVSRPHPSGRGHLVHYFYPDALHFSKVESMLSPELLRELKRLTPDQMMQQHQTRQNLNRRMVKELLVHVFKQYHGKNIGIHHVHNIQFMQDLISIHPFADYNGRTIRTYFDLAFKSAGTPVTIHALADLDLTTSAEKYQEIMLKSVEATKQLSLALASEFVAAAKEKRMPTYRDLPAWSGIWESLGPIGGQKNLTFEHGDYELIRQRRFVELFERKFSGYQVTISASCRTVFGP